MKCIHCCKQCLPRTYGPHAPPDARRDAKIYFHANQLVKQAQSSHSVIAIHDSEWACLSRRDQNGLCINGCSGSEVVPQLHNVLRVPFGVVLRVVGINVLSHHVNSECPSAQDFPICRGDYVHSVNIGLLNDSLLPHDVWRQTAFDVRAVIHALSAQHGTIGFASQLSQLGLTLEASPVIPHITLISLPNCPHVLLSVFTAFRVVRCSGPTDSPKLRSTIHDNSTNGVTVRIGGKDDARHKATACNVLRLVKKKSGLYLGGLRKTITQLSPGEITQDFASQRRLRTVYRPRRVSTLVNVHPHKESKILFPK